MGNTKFNHINTLIKKVQNSAVQRGEFQVESLKMGELSCQLSLEYLTYPQTLNSPHVSKRFGTKNYNQKKFQELAKDPRANK